MEILGVGGWELALIFVIALVVAGPARMLRWAYQLGRFFAQLRTLWAQAAASLQKEFDEAGVDIQVPKDVPTRQTLRRDLTNMVAPMVKEVRQPLDEVGDELRRTRTELKTAIDDKPAQGAAKPAPSPKPSVPAAPPSGGMGTWGAPPPPANGASPATPSPNLGTWGAASPTSAPNGTSQHEEN
ncbi:MAG: hypothetical protein MUC99_03610 [Anaerolineae bacterium]|jgi:Sec-independent protein translocase protein TatA|nr:hypothetical protein [Anaerolineae bacterium]